MDWTTAGAPRVIDATGDPETGIAFSIGCLVTEPEQYAAMRASFEAGGFAGDDCEYLVIDNTGAEQVSAYRGLNAILAAARGRYVILCHQDIRLLDDGRFELESRLSQLTARDCDWALAGNAGGVRAGELAVCITDPHGTNQRVGTLPAKVATVDENFIVVRSAASVGFSRDLTGFHFYGADICLAADLMGYAAYVIDFHLQHLSGGKKGTSFADCENAFRRKWSRALHPRWLQTTCSLIRITGDTIGQFAARAIERPYARISRRFPSARGWGGSGAERHP